MGGTADTLAVSEADIVVDYPEELRAFGKRFVMALGVFDGVHVGHQAIFRELREQAEALEAIPVALFFEPHPRLVLQPERALLRLTGCEEKMALIQRLGIRHFVRFPFTEELAGLSPDRFCQDYFSPMASALVGFCVGENWRFGRGNAGDGASLRRLTGADVRVVPSVMLGGEPVSSTRIRKALDAGDMPLAAAMLGRPVRLGGVVTHGQHLGSTAIQCPTANLAGEGVQLPKFGVYAARGNVGGIWHDGIVYVGDAPTLRGHDVVVELHLFDFDGDLYGQEMTVEFVRHLRDSRRFDTPAALKAQINRDIAEAKGILKTCSFSEL